MSKVLELFGVSTASQHHNWAAIIEAQNCPYSGKRCFKVRKSEPDIAIGTCTVNYGAGYSPVVICPNRMLEENKVFLDCIHLLSKHQPGNELHIIPEVSVPGGSIDYILTSARRGKVVDFVGIEFQTLDTTGTVWPERQRLLHDLGIQTASSDRQSSKQFGMNWKMTAKTILVQLHHKLGTFEHLNRHLVLVVQDRLLEYMQREFQFGHLESPAQIGDSMHFHAYTVECETATHRLLLQSRISTDIAGLATALGLQAEANVEFEEIARTLEAKLSASTLLKIGTNASS